MKKITAILLTILVSLTAATGASAHERYYVPKPHAKCRVDYRRETVRVRRREHHRWVRVRQVRCVYHAPAKTAPPVTAPAPPAASTISYKAGVDPSFTQSPSNPLQVTYSYSADATETVNGVPEDLAAEGELPAGVLDFYSATSQSGAVSLACSIDVGGSVTSGTCPVTYSETGVYQVTTQYIPDSASAVTETDSENIQPAATTVSVATSVGQPPPGANYFFVGVDGAIEDGGYSVASGAPLTYTITDSTTGATVESFSQPADSACAVLVTVNPPSQGTMTFGSNSCTLAGVAVPTSDSYAITAAFAGTNSFLGSTSAQSVF